MGNLTKKTITRGAVVALALSAGAATTANAAVTRTSGADRFSTATEIFKAWPTTTTTAVLAAGIDHDVDALTVAPLAKMKNAPVILVDTKATTTAIVAQFSAFTTVYIANGTGVVSADVEAALKAAGKTVVRLGGATRTETALNIAKAIGTANGIVVANGDDSHLVDTLSIASIAAAKGMPIFLTQGGALSDAEATYAKGLAATNVYALGGTTVVTDAAVAGLGTTVTRLAGAGRYETNAKIVTQFKGDLDLTNIYVASGEDANLIDALAGAPLAGLKNAPIVFAHNDVNADVNTLLNSVVTGTTNITVLGGAGAVSESVKASLVAVQAAKSATVAVSSVTALNATQLQVVFNKAVDKTSAETAANYSVGGVITGVPVLQADGKTVVVTFGTAVTLNGVSNVGITNAAVVIEPITSAASSLDVSPRFVSLLTYKDTVKPTVAKITASTNAAKATAVTVDFSEPVTSLGSVKIDGTGVTGGLNIAKTSATFTIDLDAATSHTIQFFGLTDGAANVADLFTQSFNVTVDKALPTVVVTPTANVDNGITLTFSKDMDPATVLGNAQLTVKDETLGLTFGAATIAQPDVNNKKVFTLTAGSTLFGTTSSRTFTVVLPATMTDTLTNAFAATTAKVTLTKDTVKPTISSINVVKDSAGKTVKIVINSTSTLSIGTIAGLSVVDSDGVLRGGWLGLSVSGFSAGNTSVTLVPNAAAILAGTNALSGKYTFNFAGGTLVDQAETVNNSDAVTQVVDFGAAATASGTFTIPSGNVAPVAGAVNSTLQGSLTTNTYTVDFGTAVKGGSVAGSATDLSHYTINGNSLPAGTTITLNGAKQVALITVPTGTIAKSDTAAVFYIFGVQDASGNTVVPVTTKVQTNDNTKPVLNSAVINSDNSLTFGFSETLSGIPAQTTDIIVKVNGTPIVAPVTLSTAAGTGTDTGKYVLTGLGAALKYDGTSKTYLDLDNDGAVTSGDIVLFTGTGVDKHTNKLTDFNTVSGLTIETATSALTDGAAGNVLTSGTKITIK